MKKIKDNKSMISTKNLRKELFTKKRGFTLAEVLITLGVIGIVATMTLPVLMQSVQKKIKTSRIDNIIHKLSNGTDRMAVQSTLNGYASTKDFVLELSRYMKINQICDNNQLDVCWPVKEVNLKEDGKTWEIAKTKNAKTLKIASPDNWLDTVGIVTGDGVSMILSYDKNCNFNVDMTGLEIDKETKKPTTLNCISGIFDWNGGQAPNKLGEDIQLLGNASGLGSSCAFEINGTCYTAPFKPTPVSKSECEKMIGDTYGIKECCSESYCKGKDYWAGAVQQCGGVKNMPTQAQLKEIADYIYKDVLYSSGEYDTGMLTERSNSLGLPEITQDSGFCLWSGEESNSDAGYGRYFGSDGSYSNDYYRHSSYVRAVCLGD